MSKDKDPNYPCGSAYAKEFCREYNLNPRLWGDINNVALDGYNEARKDFLQLANILRIESEMTDNPDRKKALKLAIKAIRTIIIDCKNAQEAFTKALEKEK